MGSVSSSKFYNMNIKPDGSLWAWGINRFYQSGMGDIVNITSPVQIGSLIDFELLGE